MAAPPMWASVNWKSTSSSFPAASNALIATLEISGPMPSPGKTAILQTLAYRDGLDVPIHACRRLALPDNTVEFHGGEPNVRVSRHAVTDYGLIHTQSVFSRRARADVVPG